MKSEIGETITQILEKRCGVWTNVVLHDGEVLKVFNIAWGRDLGEDYDYITTNISPEPEGDFAVDFLHISDVARIEDSLEGYVIFDINEHEGTV